MNTKQTQYIISLGSNQGKSLSILRGACKCLENDEQLHIIQKSSIYQTLPWGKMDQPVFLNAAILVSWQGEPEDLMRLLLETEKVFGRTRDIHWGPRTLDLDLIYGWSIKRQSDLLHLPHPYFWERAFVLIPIEEMLPDFSYDGVPIHQRIVSLDGYKEVTKTKDSWKGDAVWQPM